MSTATRSIKVDDTVTYRPAWGMDAPVAVKVLGMEVTQFPREKYGKEVDEVSYGLVQQNRVLFTLDNGHWCYANQIILGEVAA